MSAAGDSTRRQALRLLAAGLAAGTPVAAMAAPCADTVASRLARLFGHAASARIVGERYLALCPDERREARLVELLLADPATTAAIEQGRGQEELRACMAARVRADFRERRTVRLDGWVLARTEARLCALRALA